MATVERNQELLITELATWEKKKGAPTSFVEYVQHKYKLTWEQAVELVVPFLLGDTYGE